MILFKAVASPTMTELCRRHIFFTLLRNICGVSTVLPGTMPGIVGTTRDAVPSFSEFTGDVKETVK